MPGKCSTTDTVTSITPPVTWYFDCYWNPTYTLKGMPPVLQEGAGMKLTFVRAWLGDLQTHIQPCWDPEIGGQKWWEHCIHRQCKGVFKGESSNSKVKGRFLVFTAFQRRPCDLACVAPDMVEDHKQEQKRKKILIQAQVLEKSWGCSQYKRMDSVKPEGHNSQRERDCVGRCGLIS